MEFNQKCRACCGRYNRSGFPNPTFDTGWDETWIVKCQSFTFSVSMGKSLWSDFVTLYPRIIKLHVWDMAGQLRYGVCNPSFRAIRGIDLCKVCDLFQFTWFCSEIQKKYVQLVWTLTSVNFWWFASRTEEVSLFLTLRTEKVLTTWFIGPRRSGIFTNVMRLTLTWD